MREVPPLVSLKHLHLDNLKQNSYLAGAQIPLEDVPSVQKEIVMRCRQMGKPVIVASHLVQSMIEYPTPTRAEVSTCPASLQDFISYPNSLHISHNQIFPTP